MGVVGGVWEGGIKEVGVGVSEEVGGGRVLKVGEVVEVEGKWVGLGEGG